MHIPDGWLSLAVSLFTWGATLIALGISATKFRNDDFEKLSNIGAIAAVIFVAQMFNFPVAGGTSGHLLGAALAVYVIGVPGAILALFTVLIVQAFVFADGGVLALGANSFNMGVIGALVAGIVVRVAPKLADKENKKLFLVGAFISAFLAVIVSAFMAGVELAISGTAEFMLSIPLILFWHAIIGLGEGILTIFILIYLIQVDFPLETTRDDDQPSFIVAIKQTNKPMLGFSLLLLILSLLALIASASPDGLEFVSQSLSFEEGGVFSLGLADDYAFFGMNNAIGTLLSALLGVLIMLGLFFLPVLYKKSKELED
ncbi:MAG: energy-coupling factor ABC transporter permease [Candidatus Heimdallarchaeota archaeon]|nr:energy-coupling factor ABC transporter permease [Candidatus Heimdallarchaeota archaeon]